jgi:4-hydroxybenzoate polyprenyltransferase
VTTRQAAAFLVAQSLLGLVILLQFNALTVGLGVGSLLLVAIYPFMKRITWWPQLFLGLAFSWGALVGWTSQAGSLSLPPLLLYAGSILWVIGYDTIYALQDIEDDALIGVKSTARLFGSRARPIVGLFYAGAVILWGVAAWLAGAGPITLAGLLLVIAQMAWQLATLDAKVPRNPWLRFHSNRWVGLIFTAAMAIDWWR